MVKKKRTVEELSRTLNYQHLQYFWAVASEGNLTRAAEKMRVTQSAVSVQIRKLEEALGHRLFRRRGRGLELTSHGRLALDYASEIFATGQELIEALEDESASQRRRLRVGALATLSRNFQIALLGPLLAGDEVQLLVRSGTLDELVERLERRDLDLVLTNLLPRRSERSSWVAHTLDTQPISLVSREQRRVRKLARLLKEEMLVTPTKESGVRLAFDSLTESLGIRPRIVAEIDDMAMLRLVARQHPGVTVLPPIVVRDELASGELVEVTRIPDVDETFLALTTEGLSRSSILRTLLT